MYIDLFIKTMVCPTPAMTTNECFDVFLIFNVAHGFGDVTIGYGVKGFTNSLK